MDPIVLTLGAFLVIIGVVLFAIELIHPGALLLIPATALLAAGLLFLFLPSFLTNSAIGPAIVVLAAVAAAIGTLPYYRWIAPVHKPMTTTPDSLEGEVGLVVKAVVPNSLAGKVRVRSEIWSARADYPIPAGTKVRVLGGEGVSIRVVPVETAPAPYVAQQAGA
jgi:membrane protein implicated in regulation of membrane protease activity